MSSKLLSSSSSKTYTFRPLERHVKQNALHSLSSDLTRIQWIVEISDGAWIVASILWISLCISQGALIVSFGQGDISTYPYGIPFFGVFFESYLFSANIRRRRRARLPEYEAHCAQEIVIIASNTVEFHNPPHLWYPPDEEKIGTHERYTWYSSEVKRLIIHRANSGKVTLLRLETRDGGMTFSDYEEVDRIAELLKDWVGDRPVIKELPRLIPIWSRVFLASLGIVTLAITVWLVS